MKSHPINQDKEVKDMVFSEYIEFIKEKYPSHEERLSFINQIPEKDSSGKILLENIQKKSLLTLILLR